MPDSARIQSLLRRGVAAIVGILLAVALLTALVLAGFYLLLRALTLALIPVWGEPAALAVTGAVCLVLVVGIFWLLIRPGRAASKRFDHSGKEGASPVSQLRKLIRENPLESAMTAFALGVVEQSDPRLRSLLLQGGMVLMKEAESGSSEAEGGDVNVKT
ncbi:hypothetical protein [Marinobacter subterrani]|uniref:hypothetical protein n=1 Tax=Marinobacter subterrani TaxID=1658765 RepID=UPI002354F980|nr:hypothetical protein [Marinobacter subterrani]